MAQKEERRQILIAIAAFFLFCFISFYATKIQWDTDLNNRFLPEDSLWESLKEEKRLFGPGEKIFLLIDQKEKGHLQFLREELLSFKKVKGVIPLLKKKDRGFVFLLDVSEEMGGSSEGMELMKELNRWIEKQANPSRFTFAGTLPFQERVRKSTLEDIQKITLVLLLLEGILLFYFFRHALSLVWLAVTSALSISATFGIVGFLGWKISHTNLIVIPIILTIGLLDNIHILFGIIQHKNIREALSGLLSPCFWTTATTIGGFSVLLFSSLPQVRVFGGIVMIGTATAFFLSFTLLPGLLRLSKPKYVFSFSQKTEKWLIGQNFKRVILISALLLIFCGAGLWRLHLVPEFPDLFRKNHPITRQMNQIENDWGGMATLSYILTLKEPHQLGDKIVKERIQNFVSLLSQRERVTSVFPGGFLKEEPRTFRILLRIKMMQPDRFPELVKDLEGFQNNLSDLFETRLTGWPLIFKTLEKQFLEELFRNFVYAFVLVAFLLLIAFRSIRWWALSLPPNLLPIIVVLGILGWSGIGLTSGLLLAPGIALGLVVDDTIHIVLKSKNGLNLKETFKSVGAPLFITSAVLATGFGTLFLSSFKGNQLLAGVMIAIAVLAFLADFLLLPALLAAWPEKPLK